MKRLGNAWWSMRVGDGGLWLEEIVENRGGGMCCEVLECKDGVTSCASLCLSMGGHAMGVENFVDLLRWKSSTETRVRRAC